MGEYGKEKGNNGKEREQLFFFLPRHANTKTNTPHGKRGKLSTVPPSPLPVLPPSPSCLAPSPMRQNSPMTHRRGYFPVNGSPKNWKPDKLFLLPPPIFRSEFHPFSTIARSENQMFIMVNDVQINTGLKIVNSGKKMIRIILIHQ